MSTFGEIAEPSSRTLWEEWDDIDSGLEQESTTEIKWKNNPGTPNEIETLYLFEGKYLSDTVKLQTHYKLALVDTIAEANLSLYKIEYSNKYVCTIKDYNLVVSGEVVEALKPYLIVSKDVIAIQTKPVSEYQSTKTPQDCIIRTISTSKSQPNKMDYPKLEQPNIISGISAGAISLREHLGLNGTAIICYLEQLEEYAVEGIKQLLRKLDILTQTSNRPASILDSNLYI